MKRIGRPRWRISIAGAILGTALALTLGLTSASAQASTIPASTIPAPTGAVCVVTATGYSVQGDENVVTGTQETCYANLANYKTARQAQLAAVYPLALAVNVGYGCTAANFGGTCYYFATPSGCSSGNSAWVWVTLNAATNNQLNSMEAINGCTLADVYSLPYLTGQVIRCSNACYGLGTIAKHDESLAIGPV